MAKSGKTVEEIKLQTIEGTPESFKEFGQVIGPRPDDEDFGPQDAQLVLSEGTPRSVLFLLVQGFNFTRVISTS